MFIFGHDIWLEHQLKGLGDYVSGVREYLQVVRDHIDDRVIDLANRRHETTFDPENLPEQNWHDECDREENRLDDLYLELLYNGTVIGIWTYFESSLLRLCREEVTRLERNSGNDDAAVIQTKCDQLRDFDRVVDQLKAFGIDLKASPHWAELRSIQKIRNLLSHSSGVIYSANSPAVDYVNQRKNQKLPGLSMFNDLLIVEPEFCHDALGVIQPLLETVIRRVTPLSEATRQRMKESALAGELLSDDEV